MTLLRGRLGWALLVPLALAGCGLPPPGGSSDEDLAKVSWDYPPQDTVVYPTLGPARTLEAGVQFRQVNLKRGDKAFRVWIYTPERSKSLRNPCILIAGAGSHLVEGMKLSDGDRPEHLPYVRAGFVVVAYDLDGAIDDFEKASEAKQKEAVAAFKDAQAGLVNAYYALDFALITVPEIDKRRVYTAGHSSAGTLAVLMAEHDDRIKGCIAFAPCTDVKAFLQPNLRMLNRLIPDAREFVYLSSPRTHVAKLKCPLFLFHAEDDDVVKISESAAFVEEVKKHNPNVTFVKVPKGGHHTPMIKKGIPQAIEWVKAQAPK